MRKPAVNIAVQAARRAGAVIQRSIHRADAIAVSEKGRFDFVTEADRLAEQEIIREIRKAYPEHAIWGEESGRSGNSRYVWVIDPIDGTSNFMRGFPHCSVSIALMEEGVIQHGVVYDPVRDEIFHATKGGGAYLNDRRIRVGQRLGLAGALVATGFPFKQRARFNTQMRMVKALLEDAEDLRRTGSAALDLAYVACGRLDGYFEYGLQPWDMAAGALLVREAGGGVLDFDGDERWFDSGNVIAGNLKVAAAMVARIKPLAVKTG
ncbi:MAG: inositol monophosphatase [Xanthomonadales bacterium]|nr:Inositol-1-monophosphatase [Xanthomonadales bacterium]MCC6592818.1 inositol monophosphatase [Xanthomonadales bacterium]MCE7931567.1 inositol monophosphatase [Xanthomonadales bacterium PRO6]